MAKYAVFFTYSSDAWARMVRNPGDRTAVIRQLAESVGGSLESIYWMLGAQDGMVIVDAPDSLRVAAVSIAVGSSGTLKNVETHELFTQDQIGQILSLASGAAQVYRPPGE